MGVTHTAAVVTVTGLGDIEITKQELNRKLHTSQTYITGAGERSVSCP